MYSSLLLCAKICFGSCIGDCAETRLSRRYLYIEEKNPDKTPFRAAVNVMTEKVARSASQQYLSPSRFAIKPPGKEKKETKKRPLPD